MDSWFERFLLSQILGYLPVFGKDDGMIDPIGHLSMFNIQMNIHRVLNDVQCCFLATFVGVTF